MTDQFTPTTEQIDLLVLGQLKQTAEKRGWPVDVEADFRRWLDEVKAEAWDVGHDAGVKENFVGIPGINPYRADLLEGVGIGEV